MHCVTWVWALVTIALGPHIAALAIPLPNSTDVCQQTTIAILGAGIAGIKAAQTLSDQSISDFLIVEYQNEIGGRLHHAEFGKSPNGTAYTIEYGANWVQGLGASRGPENPIWTLAKKWKLANTPSDFGSIKTYNESGEVDFVSVIDDYEQAFAKLRAEAGQVLSENLQDRTVREGFSLVGWKPELRNDSAAADAVEWWLWDGEQATTPDESSLVFNAAVSNFTFLQFGEQSNLVTDQRGHNIWLKREASAFLADYDPRLLLNSIVSSISYSDEGVTIYLTDGRCIHASYAICTFSIGVLQHESITFTPSLPAWKQTAIEMFQMGTYTKIFLQFNHTFWDASTQFFLYADPIERGWYPIFQSLSHPSFFPGSNILFVTVVQRQAHRVEKQSDAATQDEIMAVLRTMFPNVQVPDPIAITYPRWSDIPWARGSFSNWPPATTLEMHQNIRANVGGRLWFAGEHTSASYFGYMQGAWFEGRDVGNRIAGFLGGKCGNKEPDSGGCGPMVHYEVLKGTTEVEEYNFGNGWETTSFQTNGLEEVAEPVETGV